MRWIASSDLSVDIFFASRGGEIGAMARALVVFNDNALENGRLRKERERDRSYLCGMAAPTIRAVDQDATNATSRIECDLLLVGDMSMIPLIWRRVKPL
jgi:hypothetical protein